MSCGQASAFDNGRNHETHHVSHCSHQGTEQVFLYFMIESFFLELNFLCCHKWWVILLKSSIPSAAPCDLLLSCSQSTLLLVELICTASRGRINAIKLSEHCLTTPVGRLRGPVSRRSHGLGGNAPGRRSLTPARSFSALGATRSSGFLCFHFQAFRCFIIFFSMIF